MGNTRGKLTLNLCLFASSFSLFGVSSGVVSSSFRFSTHLIISQFSTEKLLLQAVLTELHYDKAQNVTSAECKPRNKRFLYKKITNNFIEEIIILAGSLGADFLSQFLFFWL